MIDPQNVKETLASNEIELMKRCLCMTPKALASIIKSYDAQDYEDLSTKIRSKIEQWFDRACALLGMTMTPGDDDNAVELFDRCTLYVIKKVSRIIGRL